MRELFGNSVRHSQSGATGGTVTVAVSVGTACYSWIIAAGFARKVGAVVQGEFVGRRRELAYLRGWLMAAADGQPRLVLCGGEPGIGKTRLASELAKMASASCSAGVVWARASEDRGAPPFWLWRQVLPSPEVFSAHGIDRREPDQETERFAFFEDATRQLFASAAGGVVLLVLDDVHWADQPSLLLLRHLARELREVRLLVLATYRTTRADTTAGWRAVLADLIREPLTEQVELSGLSATDTTRCAEAVSDMPLSAAAGVALHSMTGGNPFFVREVARTLSASAGSDLTVPASVIELINARVERLSPLTPGCWEQPLCWASSLRSRSPPPLSISRSSPVCSHSKRPETTVCWKRPLRRESGASATPDTRRGGSRPADSGEGCFAPAGRAGD